MLRNIMTTEADYSLLREANISEEAIDFISGLLNRNPKERPKEAECFKHPWLVNVPDEFEYMDLDGPIPPPVNSQLEAVEELDEDEDLDASLIELSDLDEEPNQGEESQPSSNELTQAKRPRVTQDQDADHQNVRAPSEIKYPSLPHISSYGFTSNDDHDSTPTGPRLFGEIRGSALESSGALGQNNRPHIDLPEIQYKYQYTTRNGDDFSSNEDSSSSSLSLDAAGETHGPLSLRPSIFGESALSLMGAESLVGHLRMETFGRRSLVPTAPNSDNPPTPGANSGDGANQRHSLVQDSQDESFQSRTSGAVEVSHSKGHGGESAERCSDVGGLTSNIHKTGDGGSQYSSGLSLQSDGVDEASKRQRSNKNIQDELAMTIDERTGEEVNYTTDHDGEADSSHRTITQHKKPSQESAVETTPRAPGKSNGFTKPPALLGKLIPLPGSITDQPIRLESRMTSWGRGTHAMVRYPDPMDFRIPSYALELTFWAPSIESRIANGEDWKEMEDVVTTISTKTSRCIWINDVELRKESRDKDAFLFGKIYTGDIITVYRDREQFLRFRCEFYHGNSKQKRPENGPRFAVHKSPKAVSHDGEGGQSREATPSVYNQTIAGSECSASVNNNHASGIRTRSRAAQQSVSS